MGDAVVVREVAAPFVSWLGEPMCADARLVGGKAAVLSELRGSFPVPEGFCVTTAAYASYQAMGVMPTDVADAVMAAYSDLAVLARFVEGSGDAPPVAVRSSAVGEDGRAASFAGQHATLLNVRGVHSLLDAIEEVWRSAGHATAMAYRREHGLEGEPIAVAVLVQSMASCDASGVAFSVDPVTGRRDRIVISSSWGLGESLVGGDINPDRWILDKAGLAVLEHAVGDKASMTITDGSGTRKVRTPSFLSRRPSLSEDQVYEVARLTLRLEERFGHHVDVEFGAADDRIVLLQCRPVTAVGEPRVAHGGRV